LAGEGGSLDRAGRTRGRLDKSPHPALRVALQNEFRNSKNRSLSYRGNVMTEAFIYDAVRTPRGRGKPDGSLHEVSTLGLAVSALTSLRQRALPEPGLVDDVVLGCVDPVG